ncbi:MAG: hypothetical protein ABS76_17850 [Pelagibacterium sp. SCN 64-44]|nr:MAG: hypothetical protein ABS76_17850 [Pelagibacterium sp. SCN 64-44]
MSPRDIGLALLVAVIWGVNFVAIKWGVDEISPFVLTALRYIGCALPAVFFVRRPAVSWRLLIAYGMSVGVLQFGILFTAIHLGMPAGLSSLVMQMQVFFTMGLAMVFLAERPLPVQFGGAALALLGLGVIGSEHLGAATFWPLLLTLVAAFCWGISNILTKRAGRIDMFAFVVWGSLVPPLPMLGLALLTDGPDAITGLVHASPLAIGSVLFTAYASTLVAYGLWAVLLGRYPASLVAPFSLLVPIFGFAGAALLLGEAVTALEIGGSALIFLGLMLHVFGPRLRRR